MSKLSHLSRRDAREIVKKFNLKKQWVVIRQKNDHFRFHDPIEYFNLKQTRRESIQRHKPWTWRQKMGAKSRLGSIGSQALGAHHDLSRVAIYEDK